MGTQCHRQKLLFEAHGRREVSAAFDGGRITSDAGGLLLREVEERFGILRSFGQAFTDYRRPDAIEFTVEELLRQRVMGIALGYEDLNDHEQLRHDPLLALMAGRSDITGQDRLDERSTGVPLAGKSTLNRLELTPAGAGGHSRYKKIIASVAKLQETLVATFIRMRSRHVLATLRYIHANPQAAGMRQSWGYRYSNYAAYERLRDDGLTEWHPAFLRLADSLDACAHYYRRYCRGYQSRVHKPSGRRSHWGTRQLPQLPPRTRSRKTPAPNQLPLAGFGTDLSTDQRCQVQNGGGGVRTSGLSSDVLQTLTRMACTTAIQFRANKSFPALRTEFTKRLYDVHT